MDINLIEETKQRCALMQYGGFTIIQDRFGFCGQNGPVSIGYCESLEQLAQEIREYWTKDNTESQGLEDDFYRKRIIGEAYDAVVKHCGDDPYAKKHALAAIAALA